MEKVDTKRNACPKSLKLLGDYWTLRIIEALDEEGLRFCEVQRAVDNLNPVTLTDRLQKLEKAGLVKREQDSGGKISVSYSLTTLGKSALPVLVAIDSFAQVAEKLPEGNL